MLAVRKAVGDDYENDFVSEPEPEYERQPKRERATKRTTRNDRERKFAARHRQENRAAKKRAFKVDARAVNITMITLVVLMLFGLGGLLIQRYEKLTASNKEVYRIKSEIKKINDEIDAQMIQVEFALDLAAAQVIAEERLNMGYPGMNDVVDGGNLALFQKPEAGDDDLSPDDEQGGPRQSE